MVGVSKGGVVGGVEVEESEEQDAHGVVAVGESFVISQKLSHGRDMKVRTSSQYYSISTCNELKRLSKGLMILQFLCKIQFNFEWIVLGLVGVRPRLTELSEK